MVDDKKSGHKHCGDGSCGCGHDHGHAHEKEQSANPEQAEMQNKFIAYQVAEQQIKQHQEQLMKFQAQLNEAASVLTSLEEISKVKKGEEVLVPIAGGIFFRAKMEDGSSFLVNVGGGTVVEKSVEETKDILKRQIEEIDAYKVHVTENLANLITEFQLLESELKDMM